MSSPQPAELLVPRSRFYMSLIWLMQIVLTLAVSTANCLGWVVVPIDLCMRNVVRALCITGAHS